MIGKTVSHYRIVERLGGGGMGVVYKAEDTRLKRPVAVKFLPPELTHETEAKARFIHEARAASALDHPNIGAIHEIDEVDGQMFIVMAYYDGVTLKKKIAARELKPAECIDCAVQIVQGLAKAHKHNIVHRDIKPANIMVTTEGLVKIVDFGLAKLAGSTRITKTGTTMGTPYYMSPEQVRGLDVDHRSDLWSFGVVLYEMLTGKLPFSGENDLALLYVIVNQEPAPPSQLNPSISPELEQVIGKALQKKLENRYAATPEMLDDLKRVQRRLDRDEPQPQGKNESPAQKTTRTIPISHPSSSKKFSPKTWRSGLAGLMIILLAGAAIFLFNLHQLDTNPQVGPAAPADSAKIREKISDKKDANTSKAAETKSENRREEDINTAKNEFGALVIDTTPSGAQVYLDDKATEKVTPFMRPKLAAATYKIRLTRPGHADTIISAVVRAGQTARLQLNLRPLPLSRLNVNAVVLENDQEIAVVAAVLINGNDLTKEGATPRAFNLPEGAYRVSAKYVGHFLQDGDQVVTLRSGETKKIKFTFVKR